MNVEISAMSPEPIRTRASAPWYADLIEMWCIDIYHPPGGKCVHEMHSYVTEDEALAAAARINGGLQ